jgi:RND family efflux transporter MFP subunit
VRAEVFAVLLLASSTVACTRRAETEPVADTKLVRCAPLATAPVSDEIELRGTVAPPPDRDAQVAPQVTGRVLRVLVREGDAVAAGQAVAQIDDAPMLDTARQTDAALARAQAEHKNAEVTLARVQRVFERGIAPRQEADDAAAKEASAKAAEIEAEAAARQAHRQIERATVHSPFKGVVLKVLRRPGELVDGTPGTAIAEIADIDQLELAGDLPAQDLVRARRGAPAKVTFATLGGRSFAATVARVSPSVDRTTGLGVVRLALQPSTEGNPPVGTYGVARIATGGARPATLVPAPALRAVTGAEAEIVLCGADGAAHVRKVRLGAAHDAGVEIAGLAVDGGGARVVVDGVIGLAEGDALKTAP